MIYVHGFIYSRVFIKFDILLCVYVYIVGKAVFVMIIIIIIRLFACKYYSFIVVNKLLFTMHYYILPYGNVDILVFTIILYKAES